jgi:hypothetical protein
MTITEALQEIKTIDKRIEKKREAILQYLWREDDKRDPLGKQDGGSFGFIERERQAINDLLGRKVMLRSAITQVNMTTDLTVGKITRKVEDWLNWRREALPTLKQAQSELRSSLVLARNQQAQNVARARKQQEQSTTVPDIQVNLNEKAFADEVEGLEEIEGNLDGQLSLINATTNLRL